MNQTKKPDVVIPYELASFALDVILDRLCEERALCQFSDITEDLENAEAALERAMDKAEGKKTPEAAERLTCEDCGEKKTKADFYDPSASEPQCKECVEGFWEMMGDDPHGKDWR